MVSKSSFSPKNAAAKYSQLSYFVLFTQLADFIVPITQQLQHVLIRHVVLALCAIVILSLAQAIGNGNWGCLCMNHAYADPSTSLVPDPNPRFSV